MDWLISSGCEAINGYFPIRFKFLWIASCQCSASHANTENILHANQISMHDKSLSQLYYVFMKIKSAVARKYTWIRAKYICDGNDTNSIFGWFLKRLHKNLIGLRFPLCAKSVTFRHFFLRKNFFSRHTPRAHNFSYRLFCFVMAVRKY